MIVASVQAAPLDLAVLGSVLAEGDAGAIATFTGLVRADDGVEQLVLEHYPGVTERALISLAEEATERWDLSGAVIVHRVGAMAPGDAIVFVATAAMHRGEALAACGFLIDRLKTDAPFWKRETTAAGNRWVEARAADDDAARRWQGR